MKVVAYLRVSTDGQAQHGLGLDVQERTVRAWAKANGHKIAVLHTDAGVSGTLTDRPALADALADVRRLMTGMVVPRLDRLARDLVVQETLLAEIWRGGAEVFTCAPGEAGYLANDPDDPSRKLIRQVLGAVSSYEREMVILRMRRGRERKAERGGYAGGAPPFGWRSDGGRLVSVPAQQSTLRLATSMHMGGCSLREIATALNAEKRPAPRGGAWCSSTVGRVLNRQTARTA